MFYHIPDFLALTGSQLYGYASPESDYDVIGFVLPPPEYVLGLENFNHHTNNKGTEEGYVAGKPCDCAVYSLNYFFHLLLNNDTRCLEALFAPDNKILKNSHYGETLIKNRDLFISKKLYKRFAGYAFGEYKKFMGGNGGQHPLGEKRRADIVKYGYSVKNAGQCLRLLMQGIDILNTGELKFPLSDDRIQLIKKVRHGELSTDAVETKYFLLMRELDEAYDKCTLQAKPNYDKINELLIEMNMRKYINMSQSRIDGENMTKRFFRGRRYKSAVIGV